MSAAQLWKCLTETENHRFIIFFLRISPLQNILIHNKIQGNLHVRVLQIAANISLIS